MQIKTWVMATILFSGAFALMILMTSDAVSIYGSENIINPEVEERYESANFMLLWTARCWQDVPWPIHSASYGQGVSTVQCWRPSG